MGWPPGMSRSFLDRLYGEELSVLEAEGYDFELAGARLIGHDAARVISPDTRNRVRAILESEPLRPR
jgi:predicted nucleotidyltransferase